MSVRPQGTTRRPLEEFWWTLIFKIFLKNLSRKWQKEQVLYINTFSHLWQYLAECFVEWEMFYRQAVEKIKIHALFSIKFFRKSCCLWDNIEKCCGAREATNDNMAHARCMLDTQGYTRTCTHSCAWVPTHTQGLTNARAHTRTKTQWNTQCLLFFAATMVSWTRLIVTLYALCLSCCTRFQVTAITAATTY